MPATFKGGFHPPDDFKWMSKARATEDAPVPELLTVSLSQHIGAPANPTVQKGDEVLRGRLIGEPAGFVSACVHSPVSGKVKAISTCRHPLGMTVPAVVIENDGRDAWAEGCDEPQERDTVDSLDPKEIIERIKNAGIVGMGGATFPTHVKLSPPAGKPIDTIVLNGIECEPYLTADYRLMLEKPEEVLRGFKLMAMALGFREGRITAYVGIEANKADAFEVMSEKARDVFPEARFVLLPVKYPQGAEKQLIKAILDRNVPPQSERGLPMDVGVVVQNVATAYATYEAIELNRPLTERVCTFSGDGFRQPGNARVRIGSDIDALAGLFDFSPVTRRVVFGGPIMGIAQFTTSLPVMKGTGGVLALKDPTEYEQMPCINCGRCVDACPMDLIPSRFSILGEAGMTEEMEQWHVIDCIECGACTYVCPSKRKIVHYIKVGKVAIAAKAKAAQKK